MIARLPFAARLTVALIAAYVLVLQGLFGGVLAGQHAGLLALDQTILTSCDPAGTGAAQPLDTRSPAHLPECCTQGCQLAAAGLGPMTATATAFTYPRSSVVRPAVPARDPGGHARPDGTDGRPRAPPARA